MKMNAFQAAIQELKAEGFDGQVTFRDGPRVAPQPAVPLKKNKLGFNYAEHRFIGDTITLTFPNNQSSVGADYPFTLPNGLSVTYGQINELAGDFYWTTYPISDGPTPKEQADRFQLAYATLAQNQARQPVEAQKIVVVLQDELMKINNALKGGLCASKVYSTLDFKKATVEFQAITLSRPSYQPSYLGLAKINWDHFGADARTAYNVGHTMALQQATQGSDPQNLSTAYTMNAFADHFLEDSFSAGHARTPRRQLSSTSGEADLCAMYMHDEDNAIGLDVVNPTGFSWHLYGNKRLLDEDNVENLNLVTKAIQTSVDEIFQAWWTQQIPTPDSYQVWQYAPTLKSARAATQALAPLFTFEDHPQRRADVARRRLWKFTTNYWYATTALACKLSGLWADPITLGPAIASTGGQPSEK